MTPPRLLVATVLLLLPAIAAHADWQDMGPMPRITAPSRLPAEPMPQAPTNIRALAASACYAGPVSCNLLLPLRPGQPCHCHSKFGNYWGSAR